MFFVHVLGDCWVSNAYMLFPHVVFVEGVSAGGAVDVVDADAAVGAPVAGGASFVHVVAVHGYSLVLGLIRVGFICVWG